MSSQLSQHTSIFHCKLNRVNSCLIQAHLQTFTSTLESKKWRLDIRDLRSFVIRFDFESYVRFEIRFVLMVRFEIFESSALSIVICKETIGGG